MRRRRYFGGHHRVRANPPMAWKKTTLHWLEDHPYRHHAWMRRFVGRLEQATDDATIMKLKKQLQNWLEDAAADESAALGESPSAADINRALLMGTLGIGDSGIAITDVPGVISQPDRLGHGVHAHQRRRRAVIEDEGRGAVADARRQLERAQEQLPGIAATHALFMLQIRGDVPTAVVAVEEHGLILADEQAAPYQDDNITHLHAWGTDENVVRRWQNEPYRTSGNLFYYRVESDAVARTFAERRIERGNLPHVLGRRGLGEPHRVGPRGTVISGTLRPQDLIPAFYSELQRVDPVATEGTSLSREMEAWWEEFAGGADTDPEHDDELVETLTERLNAAAPEGVYFGGHPDLGADFGWWENEEDEPPVRCEQCGVDVDDGAINVGNLPFCSRDCVTEYQRETPEWEARDAQARHDLPTADENLERLEQRVIDREAQRVREETGTRPGGSFAYRLFIRGNRAQAVNAAELRGFTVIESRTLPSDDRDRYRTGVDAWTLDGDATDDWFERTRRSQDRPGSLLYAEELSAAIAGEPPTEITYDDLDHFTQAYIAAALWSTNDESTPAGGVPLEDNYGPYDIAPDTLRQMLADCVRFRAENAADLRELDNTEQAGHDFWLTREGYGVGFWDRDLGELGERLSEAASRFGEFSLTIGDDGMIHH